MKKRLTFDEFLKERGIYDEVMVVATEEVRRLQKEYDALPWYKKLVISRMGEIE
jgi:hypothetical protein